MPLFLLRTAWSGSRFEGFLVRMIAINHCVLSNERMSQITRLARLWNWLPAFRAVAETEHLPRAGEALSVTPPTLSRAVKLLERDLGLELFHRSGRSLVLNDRGRVMLGALRDAMDRIDGGLDAVLGDGLEGRVRVFSSGVVTTAGLLPALRALRAEHPRFRPHLVSDATDVLQRLRGGEIDVGFLSDALRHPDLVTEHLGIARSGVYCGPDHPLAARPDVGLEEILEHDFVGPPPDELGRINDGWPARPARRFGAHVDQMRLGREACATLGLLAVLPDAVARSTTGGPGLVRLLADDVIPPIDVYATTRKSSQGIGAAHAIIEAVRTQLTAGADA